MESILTSIKILLGIDEKYTQFDTNLIMHINSVFNILTEIGVGPINGFSITNEYQTWEDFLGDDPRLELVKSYVHLKVKLIFDPPLISSVITATQETIKELEWRISVYVDPGEKTNQ